MNTLSWYDIGNVPKGISVDVLYINETFKPASCGILYDARTCPDYDFFMTGEGATVPAVYCVGWRHARREEAKLRAFPEHIASMAALD